MKKLSRIVGLVSWSPLVFSVQMAHAQLTPTYSNASLKGTYSGVAYMFHGSMTVPQGFESDLGTGTFDGAGNVAFSLTSNSGGVIVSGSSNATYSVAADGSVTVSGGVNGTGFLADGGRILLASHMVNGKDPTVVVLARRDDPGDNTRNGADALVSNTTGVENTATGAFTLFANTGGSANTASGYGAMHANATGATNTAFGANALYSNTVGKGNAAQGVNALYYNTTGIRNLGIGSNALYHNVSGSYNIALGFDAGSNVTTGSNNIEIGSSGTASDNGTIQIGAQGTQTSAKIAGIYGHTVTGSAVYVTSTGQLGVLASSERFKTGVETMGAASEKLERLRPVTFRLKTDPTGTVQYGLIAEEVAKVYPELVIHGADGRIDGVRYEELAPMLLNMVQRQQATIRIQSEKGDADARNIEAQAVEMHTLNQQIVAQSEQLKSMQQQVAELKDLKQALQAALLKLQAKEDLLAQR
jgi:Chaperone of endosialidase